MGAVALWKCRARERGSLGSTEGVSSAGHGGRIGARPAANPKLMAARISHTPALRARPPRARAVKAGDRIAQLVLERIATPAVEEVASLDDTERGAGGFGSTGVAQQQ